MAVTSGNFIGCVRGVDNIGGDTPASGDGHGTQFVSMILTCVVGGRRGAGEVGWVSSSLSMMWSS